MKGRGKSAETIRKEMRVTVGIPYDEADRLAVNSLIGLREFLVDKGKDVSAFDEVLRNYLDEAEFEEYVINKEPIEYLYR